MDQKINPKKIDFNQTFDLWWFSEVPNIFSVFSQRSIFWVSSSFSAVYQKAVEGFLKLKMFYAFEELKCVLYEVEQFERKTEDKLKMMTLKFSYTQLK